MPKLTINGQSVEMPPDATVLEAIREVGEYLPTLCHFEGLPPYGACRLCLVDLVEPANGAKPGVIAACAYPVEDGLVVDTHAPSRQPSVK